VHCCALVCYAAVAAHSRCCASRSRDKRGASRAAIGLEEVGYREQMMVAPANVAPGLAACACADRPASFSEIFHRRTGAKTWDDAIIRSRGVQRTQRASPETAAQKRRISRPAAALSSPALAIVLYLMQAMRSSLFAVGVSRQCKGTVSAREGRLRRQAWETVVGESRGRAPS
jgi:hypothetical protein